MTLPASGAISFNAINVELGVAGTTQASLGQASYRTLAGVASGAISLSNFYGKSNRVSLSYTFSGNTANAALNVSTLGGYIAGKSDITVTINSGVWLYATTTANAGLTINSSTAGDTLTIVNNGVIMGYGGVGGNNNTTGSTAGSALSLSLSATINNTNGSAYILGGGGGGGGCQYGAGGSGAGGANSYRGAAGGGIGATGANGINGTDGGAGGRVLLGVRRIAQSVSGAGVYSTPYGGQCGGTGMAYASSKYGGAQGGFGAAYNEAGGNGSSNNSAGFFGSGGGGGYGQSGGYGVNGTAVSAYGGAGGRSVQLNGNSVSWVSGDTTRVRGAIS